MTINGTRFYKPRRLSSMTKKEALFAQNDLEDSLPKSDVPFFDFVSRKDFLPEMSRRVAMSNIDDLPKDSNKAKIERRKRQEESGLGDFQITYNFPATIRNNLFPTMMLLNGGKKAMGEYGEKGWSFRMLYEFLCDVFNGGVPFIDTYFEYVFKSRLVYQELMDIWDGIQDDVNTEILDALMRDPNDWFKNLGDFEVWKDPIKKARCSIVAEHIRNDIEQCLATGKIPIRGKKNPKISRQSEQVRARFSGMLHRNRLFYASGRLIKSLYIFVEVGEKVA